MIFLMYQLHILVSIEIHIISVVYISFQISWSITRFLNVSDTYLCFNKNIHSTRCMKLSTYTSKLASPMRDFVRMYQMAYMCFNKNIYSMNSSYITSFQIIWSITWFCIVYRMHVCISINIYIYYIRCI